MDETILTNVMLPPETLAPATITGDIETYEQAMRDLLMAAGQGVRLECGHAALLAATIVGTPPAARLSTWPGIYRHAARLLRERCIALGTPRSRYVAGHWLRLGL